MEPYLHIISTQLTEWLGSSILIHDLTDVTFLGQSIYSPVRSSNRLLLLPDWNRNVKFQGIYILSSVHLHLPNHKIRTIREKNLRGTLCWNKTKPNSVGSLSFCFAIFQNLLQAKFPPLFPCLQLLQLWVSVVLACAHSWIAL